MQCSKPSCVVVGRAALLGHAAWLTHCSHPVRDGTGSIPDSSDAALRVSGELPLNATTPRATRAHHPVTAGADEEYSNAKDQTSKLAT
jgi:hypothetical protein